MRPHTSRNPLPSGADVAIMASNLPQYSREIIGRVVQRVYDARGGRRIGSRQPLAMQQRGEGGGTLPVLRDPSVDRQKPLHGAMGSVLQCGVEWPTGERPPPPNGCSKFAAWLSTALPSEGASPPVIRS